MTHYHPSTPWEKVKDLEHFSDLLSQNETLKNAYDDSRYQLAAGVLPKTGVLLCFEKSGYCLSYKHGHWYENGRFEVPGMISDFDITTPQASDSDHEFYGRKYGQFTMISENSLIYTGWGYSIVYEDDLSEDNFEEFGSWKKDTIKSMNFERICHTTIVDKNTGTIYALGGTNREDLPILEVEQLSAGSETWEVSDFSLENYVCGAGGIFFDNKLFLVGGHRDVHDSLNDVVYYDLDESIWKKLKSLTVVSI